MLNKNAEFSITCPKCKHDFLITIGQVQSGKTISCPQCQQEIDAKDLQKALKEIEKKLKDLGKSTSKTINIKFKL